MFEGIASGKYFFPVLDYVLTPCTGCADGFANLGTELKLFCKRWFHSINSSFVYTS